MLKGTFSNSKFFIYEIIMSSLNQWANLHLIKSQCHFTWQDILKKSGKIIKNTKIHYFCTLKLLITMCNQLLQSKFV